MMRLAALALLAGAAQEAPLTLATARQMPDTELVAQVLQAPDADIERVSVWDVRGRPFNFGRVLFEIDFADRPVATASAGLCFARVRTASFEPAGKGEPERQPARLAALRSRHFYAFVPEESVAGRPMTNASCAALGPVRRVPGKNHGYFEIYGEIPSDKVVAYVLDALISAPQKVASGQIVAGCDEDPWADIYRPVEFLCKNAAQSLRSVDWRTIDTLSIAQCPDSGETCVRAILPRPMASGMSGVEIEVTVRLPRLSMRNGEVERGDVRAVSLRGWTRVD